MYTRKALQDPVSGLCAALSTSPLSIPTVLSHFTRLPLPTIHEHGHPSLAPFVGRTFTGTDGAIRYFELLQTLLTIQNVHFDPEHMWTVDTDNLTVCVRGNARFTWKATGQSWDETFCYRLGLAEETDEGGDDDDDNNNNNNNDDDDDDDADKAKGKRRQLKVQEYLVWSDTGSVYLAQRGELKDVQEERARQGQETSRSRERRRSGCGEVVGSGLGTYGSCR